MKFLVSIVLSLLSVCAFAQKELRVLDEEGNGLPFAHATVLYPGGEEVLTTDSEGRLIIEEGEPTGEERFIRFDYVGFEPQTIAIPENSRLDITMIPALLELGEVVVTGEFGPTHVEHAVHRVDIIDRKEIEASGSADIADVLRHTGEVQIQQNGVIGTGISIQGLNDRNVKITINEVPMVGRIDGKLDLGQLDIDNIERIEVIKGPMAVSYGSDAIAGVINIITKDPVDEPLQFSLKSYSSSEGQYDVTGRIQGSIGDTYSYSVRAGRRYFDGWTEGDRPFREDEQIADERRNRTWNAKEQYQAGFSQEWRTAKGTWSHTLDYLDETLLDRGSPVVDYIGETIFGNDQRFLVTRLDNNIRYRQEGLFGGDYKGFIAWNHFNRERVRFKTDLTDIEEFGAERDTTLYDSWTTRHTWSRSLGERLAIQFGLDGSYERSDGERIAGEPDITQAAVFLSGEYEAVEGLLLRPGFRYAHHSLFETEPIPSVAIRFRRRDHTVRASAGRGFRTPDFKELYLAFFDANHNVSGNPDLSPERSWNLGLSYGVQGRIDEWRWTSTLAGFYNDVDELISLVQVGADNGQGVPPFTYRNLDRVTTQGLRLDIGLAKNDMEMKLGLGTTGREQFQDGSLFIPMDYNLQTNASMRWSPDRLGVDINLLYTYIGENRTVVINDDDDIEEFVIQGYHNCDVSLGKKVLEDRLSIQIGIRNVLDVSDIATATGGAGVHNGSSGSFPVMTGRNYFASLEWSMKLANRKP